MLMTVIPTRTNIINVKIVIQVSDICIIPDANLDDGKVT